MSQLPHDVPEFLNAYIGIPYVDKGRDYNGVDCFGVLRLIFKEHTNIILPDHRELYRSVRDGQAIEAALTAQSQSGEWIRVEEDQHRLFDVLWMSGSFLTKRGWLEADLHVAMVVSQFGWAIEAEHYTETRLMDYRNDLSIKPRIKGVFRHASLY